MKKLFSLAICVMALLFVGCKPNNSDKPISTYKAKAFSVSPSKQVYFSKGNLQYTQSTKRWSFAENQWEIIGTDNVTGGNVESNPKHGDEKEGNSLADKVDLFGWSTSSTYFGVSTSTNTLDYSAEFFVDWGKNKIEDNAPNTWRTLTYNEWDYVVFNRPNASSLKGIAQVNGVNGLVLLPDNWTCPSGVTFKSGSHREYTVKAYRKYQTFTASQWSELESAGAVFLPASGTRSGSYVDDVQRGGLYWSATGNYYLAAGSLHFCSDGASVYDSGARYTGRSVRLVKDLQ